ncbi:MAG TPA: response regulator transcription factor [Puia sp.]|nr:response regulator transcription factor [Puia sp.]
MHGNQPLTIAIADDHALVRKALINLINSFDNYRVILDAGSGNELLRKLASAMSPEIVVLDIIMKDGNGYETAAKIHREYPQIKILALSVCTEADSVVRMFKAGARGFISKDMEPRDLQTALDKVNSDDLYLPANCASFVLDGLFGPQPKKGTHINDRELKFLKYLSTDMTYKEIADEMFISPKTLDDYKSNLCSKLKVKSRSGLVTYAIKTGLIEI